MSKAIAKELDNTKQGDRGACPTCSPKKDQIPMWKVWQYSLRNIGKFPYRETSDDR